MTAKRFETSTTLPKYFSDLSELEDGLTLEEEQTLADRISKGDERALNQLVEANLKYVVTIANNFIGMGVPIDDLIQEGNLGLIEAARKYRPAVGTKFLTYAKFHLRKRMNLALCNFGRTVRLPVNQEYDIYKQKMRGESVNLANVRIDTKVGEDKDVNLGDLILHEDFCDPFRNEGEGNIMRIMLNALKPSEKRIVELFYGLNGGDGMPTKEVAEVVGKTPVEVNRALKVARAKMKRKVL